MSLRASLCAGLAYQSVRLEEPVISRLLDFVALLDKWNRVYNLTAVRDPEVMISRHILDSLSILPFVKDGDRVADLGSGGGLPGIPLAIASPNVHVTLIDSNNKKTRFLRHAAATLDLDNVAVIHNRIERVQVDKPFSCLMARAFALPDKIVHLAGHLCAQQGRLVLMAGQLEGLDLTQTPGFSLCSTTSVTVYGEDASRHVLVFVRN